MTFYSLYRFYEFEKLIFPLALILFLLGCGDKSDEGKEVGKNSLPRMISVEISPQSPSSQTDLSASVKGEDPDRDRVTYTFEWFKNGEPIEGAKGKNLPYSFFQKGDEITVKVTPSDGKGKGEPVTSSPVAIINTPPSVTSIKITYLSENDPRSGFRTLVESKDLDGDDVSYEYIWKRNEEEIAGATADTLEWSDEFKKGDKITVEVVPFDGTDEGAWRAEASIVIPNSPPRITSEPPNRTEGGEFNYQLQALDPDGDPVTFELEDAPQGMEINPETGLITWRFSEKDAGDYTIKVVARDAEGGRDTQSISFKVSK